MEGNSRGGGGGGFLRVHDSQEKEGNPHRGSGEEHRIAFVWSLVFGQKIILFKTGTGGGLKL